mmetsp:Transcript_29812/g.58369  ORF Transcript_29812/g.58369 Transcript_29812/m.58369 type:complete len:233 (-) Transcript_29812:216-914(-)
MSLLVFFLALGWSRPRWPFFQSFQGAFALRLHIDGPIPEEVVTVIPHLKAGFGPVSFNVTGVLKQYPHDGTLCTLPHTTMSSLPFTPAEYYNSIVLTERGGCTFMQKVTNAELMGASAVVCGDNVLNYYHTKMADDPTYAVVPNIPSVFILYNDFRRILETSILSSGATVRATVDSKSDDNVVEEFFENYGMGTIVEEDYYQMSYLRQARLNLSQGMMVDVSRVDLGDVYGL